MPEIVIKGRGVKISGGILRGRKIKAPSTNLRPTQDRVREAVFSSIAAWVPEARFLDLFAGSGAVGIEAWSRGAERVCLVEQDRKSCRAIETAIKDLEVSGAHCICADACKFLSRAAFTESFDVIFADPPYELTDDKWLGKALEHIATNGWLADDGRLVIESRARSTPDAADWDYPGWSLMKTRNYGSTCIRTLSRLDDRVEIRGEEEHGPS